VKTEDESFVRTWKSGFFPSRYCKVRNEKFGSRTLRGKAVDLYVFGNVIIFFDFGGHWEAPFLISNNSIRLLEIVILN